MSELRMEKLSMESVDITKENIKKIKELFPQVVTEGKIDFDVLKEILGEQIESRNERYQFTWSGKSDSIRFAQRPSTGTLRPDIETSKSWDSTENLYIEGDNLEVLKLLQKSYHNEIKMIYIDPPYNTGGDFVYKDDFKDSIKNYKEQTNQTLRANPETSGRYHTDWLNMMYPRLMLAKNLLSDDGIILISIDENELTNLKKMCEEIFGENNIIANFIWRGGRRNASKFISVSHEYMLAIAKDLEFCSKNEIKWLEKKKGIDEIYKIVNELTLANKGDFEKSSQLLKDWFKKLPYDHESKMHEHYCWIDENGVYFASDISRGGGGGPKWEITNPGTGQVVKTPQRGWAYSKIDELQQDIKNNRIHFNGEAVPCRKIYLKNNEFQLAETVFYKDRRGSSQRLRKLLGDNVFDFPKDESIIQNKIDLFSSNNSTILDFFSGSSTTAHAVMQLNAEGGGNRKFIMVQLPEKTDEKSEAYQAGYKNICEIGKERIRRAGDKIKNELIEKRTKQGMLEDEVDPEQLDIGFKVFKLDTSSLKKFDNSSKDLENFFVEDIFLPDRSSFDILYEILLKYGIFDKPVDVINVNGKEVFSIAMNQTIVFINQIITEDDVLELVRLAPREVIVDERGFKNDNDKINALKRMETAGVEKVATI